jgi:hypothetical protein
MPPRPSVLGSDAVTVGAVATNGEFLYSVKAVKAMTRTIADMVATMAPFPHRDLACCSASIAPVADRKSPF